MKNLKNWKLFNENIEYSEKNVGDYCLCQVKDENGPEEKELNDFYKKSIGKIIDFDIDADVMPYLIQFEDKVPDWIAAEWGDDCDNRIWVDGEDILISEPDEEALIKKLKSKEFNL